MQHISNLKEPTKQEVNLYNAIFYNNEPVISILLFTYLIKYPKMILHPQGYTTHTLRLHSCWEITNHGVVNMVHSLPNLTALSLSGCSKITDDGVELVAENLRKLRSLDLSWCPRITDMALEYIACDLHKLEELVLDRSESVCGPVVLVILIQSI